MVVVAGWAQYRWLRHGFSTRADGDARAGLAGWQSVARVHQVHGNTVLQASLAANPQADGLVTDKTGLAVGVLTADCVPVLLADTRRRVVAALHAGWRGTAAGIVAAGVARMVDDYGCRMEDLIAAVGPSIGPCCYTVGEDLREHFAPELFAGDRLDLWEANRRQLVAAGVPDVTVVGECTTCTRVDGERKYFSYRAEQGAENWTGRMLNVIELLP